MWRERETESAREGGTEGGRKRDGRRRRKDSRFRDKRTNLMFTKELCFN